MISDVAIVFVSGADGGWYVKPPSMGNVEAVLESAAIAIIIEFGSSICKNWYMDSFNVFEI